MGDLLTILRIVRRWQIYDQIAHFVLLNHSDSVADDLQCAHCLLKMLLVEISAVRVWLLDPCSHTVKGMCVAVFLLVRQAILVIC